MCLLPVVSSEGTKLQSYKYLCKKSFDFFIYFLKKWAEKGEICVSGTKHSLYGCTFLGN